MPAGLGGPGVWAFWKVWEGWEAPGASRPGGRRVGGSWSGPEERRFFLLLSVWKTGFPGFGGRGGWGGLILIRIQSFIDNG